MNNDSDISYLITSITIFLTIFAWLLIINEKRNGVYFLFLSISLVISSYIVDSKSKYRLIIDIFAILLFAFILGLEIIGILIL